MNRSEDPFFDSVNSRGKKHYSDFIEHLQETYPKYHYEITVDKSLEKRLTSNRQEIIVTEIVGRMWSWNTTPNPFNTRTFGRIVGPSYRANVSGEVRGPDVGFISNASLAVFANDAGLAYPRWTIDVVVEISTTTALCNKLYEKFRDTWIPHGCSWGWLIDAEGLTIDEYDSTTGTWSGPESFYGTTMWLPVTMPGFQVDFDDIAELL